MSVASIYFLLVLSSSISLSAVSYGLSSMGRNLLQAKKPCPVNFESINYTVITSRCKEPTYPANLCCPAFKEFACPYNKELNDLSNDCTNVMFSYINLYGHYPAGIFSNLCHDDKNGLDCGAVPPGPANGGVKGCSNNILVICNLSLMLILTIGFMILF